MNTITEIYNTREIAIIIWLTICFIYALSNQKIRESLVHVVKAIFAKAMFISILLMLTYISIMLFAFNNIGLWDKSLAKETFYWFIGVAFILFINCRKISEDDHYAKKILLDNLKLIIILEFIINLYTFNLLLELVLVPFLVITTMVSAYAESKEEYKPAKKLADFIMVILGLWFIIHAVYNVIDDYQNLLNLSSLQKLFLPFLLTVAFLPFTYILALYASYELLFMRIGFFMKDKALFGYTKRKLLLTFHFDIKSLNKWGKQLGVPKFDNKSAVINSLNEFKNMK